MTALLQQYHGSLTKAIETIKSGNLSGIDGLLKHLEYISAARDKIVNDLRKETTQVKIMQVQLESEVRTCKNAEAPLSYFGLTAPLQLRPSSGRDNSRDPEDWVVHSLGNGVAHRGTCAGSSRMIAWAKGRIDR